MDTELAETADLSQTTDLTGLPENVSQDIRRLISTLKDRRIPIARELPNLDDVVRRQRQKGGIAAIIGQWPGDETDEEFERALRELN